MTDVQRAPLVSVLVPLYNQAQYVRECLDSVAQCDYSEIEIIVIDDGSTDGSREVVQSWRRDNTERFVKYIRHTGNQGICRSLNDGIRAADGEFIALLASDDMLLPNGILDRVEYLLGHTEKLAVFADCHVIRSDGSLHVESGIEDLYPYRGMRKKNLESDSSIAENVICHWGVPGPVFMCRAKAYQIVGSYDESLLVEDWDMYLRIAATGRLGFLPAYVAKYRVHSANMCSTRQKRIALDLYRTAK